MDTDQFLDRVRETAQISPTDEDWTSFEILTEATQCMYERFVQPVVTTRSGYWLQNYDIETTAGINFYRIPPRAVVQGLELFCMTAPSNTANGNWSQLGVMTNAQAVDYENETLNGVPQFFAFQADGIVLYPTPQDVRPLRMKYYLRPPQLVAVPSYDGIIVRPETASVTSLVEPVATNLPWVAGDLVDIVNTDGSSEAIAVGLTIADVLQGSGESLVYLVDVLTDVQIFRINESPNVAMVSADTAYTIPLPQELQSSLVTYTAAVILVDRGDAEKAAQLVSRCEASVKAIIDVMTPRVKTRPFVFKTKNTFLRRRAGWQTGYW